jgi:multisubunit Na+/H+ antiporter MnhC subunit
MVLTGIVVSVSFTAVALILAIHVRKSAPKNPQPGERSRKDEAAS